MFYGLHVLAEHNAHIILLTQCLNYGYMFSAVVYIQNILGYEIANNIWYYIYSFVLSKCCVLLRVIVEHSRAYPGNAWHKVGIQHGWDASPLQNTIHKHTFTQSFATRGLFAPTAMF